MLRAKLRSLLLVAGFGTGILLSAASSATLVAIPAGLIGAEQPAPDSSPLGADATAYRFQMVYGASLLGGLNIGDIITGMSFRIDATEAAHNSDLPAQTVDSYEIGIGSSLNAPGSLSLTFADNRGGDFVIARSGPLTFNAGDFTGGAEPNAFGVIITFSTSYVYTGGALLIEIAHDGSFSDGRFVDDSAWDFPDAEQIFGLGFDSTYAVYGSEPQAMPILLQITRLQGPGPNNVPEPNGASLFAAALAGLMGVSVVARRQRSAPARRA